MSLDHCTKTCTLQQQLQGPLLERPGGKSYGPPLGRYVYNLESACYLLTTFLILPLRFSS